MIQNRLFLGGLLAFFTLSLSAQPGALDPSFGSGGKVATPIGAGTNDRGFAVAVQPDGKILVAGFSFTGTNNDFALIRYLPGGTPDPGFGSGGKVTTDFGVGDDEAYAVTIRENGMILVAGFAWNGANHDIALAQYQPSDGSPDPAFGLGGKVTTGLGDGADLAYAVAFQPGDHKILVAGSRTEGANSDFALLRYHPNGTLDASFDGDGITTTDFNLTDDRAQGMAIRPDGRILLGGFTSNGLNSDFALARFNSDGSPDLSFSGDGKTTTDLGGNDFGRSVLIQPDGKIVLAGESGQPDFDFAVARYFQDGSPDNSWGGDGAVITPVGLDFADGGRKAALQSDGKILVAGYSGLVPDYDFTLVRYQADGSPDYSFGVNGIVVTDFSGSYDSGEGIAILPDGKYVVAGHSASSDASDFDFALARYISGLVVGVSEIPGTENSARVFPNPVADEAVLEYTLARPETLSLQLCDPTGRPVKTFFRGESSPGGAWRETLRFEKSIPAGNYRLVLSSGSQTLANLPVLIFKN
jgi:uncharacterized delta-60 repeat protein